MRSAGSLLIEWPMRPITRCAVAAIGKAVGGTWQHLALVAGVACVSLAASIDPMPASHYAMAVGINFALAISGSWDITTVAAGPARRPRRSVHGVLAAMSFWMAVINLAPGEWAWAGTWFSFAVMLAAMAYGPDSDSDHGVPLVQRTWSTIKQLAAFPVLAPR